MQHGDNFIYRYRSNRSDFLIDELENNYIYFANRTQLNDPYDCFPGMIQTTDNISSLETYLKTIKRFKERSRKERRNAEKSLLKNGELFHIIEKQKNQTLDKIGIASFSVQPVNLMLWSHYANNHKGICLQFDKACDESIFSKAYDVKYIETLPKMTFDPSINEEKIFFEALRSKSSVWSEEEEIRLMKTTYGKYKFNTNSLKSIIFGLSSEESFKDRIMTATKFYSDLRYYDVEPLKREFGLKIIERKT